MTNKISKAIFQPGCRWPTRDERSTTDALFARLSAEYREARRITYWQLALAVLGLIASLAIGRAGYRGNEVSVSALLTFVA